MALYDVSDFNDSVTVEGAIITNDPTAIATGTGVYDAFLSMQASPEEEAFNTDDGTVLDGNHDNFTHSVLLSTIPTVTIDGVVYLEFRSDLNESDKDDEDLILLQQLKIFQAGSPTLNESDWTGEDFGDAATLKYSLGDNQVLLSDEWNAGSGKGDYIFRIPASNFDFTSPDQYIVVYMKMGTTDGDDPASTNATFEEFGVLKVAEAPPSIHLEKVASPTEVGEGTSGEVVYTYELTNTSPAGAADPLTLTSFVDDSGTPGVPGDDVNLLSGFVQGVDYGDFYQSGDDGDYFLEAGETWVFEDTRTVDTSVVGAEIHNVAVVSAHDNEGLVVHDDDDATVTVVNALPVITIVKTGTESVSEGGGEVTFHFVIKNESGTTDPVTITSLVDSVYGDLKTVAEAAFGGTIVLAPGAEFSFDFTPTEELVRNAGDNQTNTVVVIGEDDEGFEDDDSDDHTVVVTDLQPAIKVVKTADPTSIFEGSSGDVTYTYVVTNTSPAGAFDPLLLTSFVDDNGTPGDESDDVNLLNFYVSGDTDNDGLVDFGTEAWTFEYTRHFLDTTNAQTITNVAEVTGQDDEDNSVSAHDDATVVIKDVLPAITLVKTVDANGDGVFNDFETVQAFGDSVTYKYELTNTSPEAAVDPLTIDDLTDDGGQFAGFDLVVDGNVAAGVTFAGDDGDKLLEAGETWTFTKTVTVNLNPGEHLVNTAEVTGADDEGSPVTDQDTADIVQAVVGPGVRTPGFWGNLGLAWWDGVDGNEGPKANLPNFPDGELTYTIDLDGNDATPEVTGLLIGDYNKNGEIDTGEDVFYITLEDAHKVIDASQKVSQDVRYVLERDMIATWLNFLAGNPIGDATDENSPHAWLDQLIDWQQALNGGTAADTFGDWGGGQPVKASDAKWTTDGAIAGVPDSGNDIHQELDSYNNTGSTFEIVNIGGVDTKIFHMYASDAG
jgi:hypothetical protein